MDKQLRNTIDKYQGKSGWVRYIISGGKVVPEILASKNKISNKLHDLATAEQQDKLARHQLLPARIFADHNFMRVDDIGAYLEKGDSRSRHVAAKEAPREIKVRPVGYILFDYSANTIPLVDGAPLVANERGELVRWLRNEQFATNAGKNSTLKKNHLANHELGVKTLVDTKTSQWTHLLDESKTDIYNVPVM